MATAGPCGTWRIFAAVSKKPGAAGRRPAAGCSGSGGRSGQRLVNPNLQHSDPTPKHLKNWVTYAGAVFPEVCVWILDKKTLLDAASRAGRVRAFDAFFEQQRRACAQMLRVRRLLVCGLSGFVAVCSWA